MIERRERRSRFAGSRRRVKPTDISGWVLVMGLVGFIAAVYLFTRDGCDNEYAALLRLRLVKVDTWAEWREHLSGTDLYLKYGALNVNFEPDAIRADFVKTVPRQFLRYPETAQSAETVNLTNIGTTLHIATQLHENEFHQWKRALQQKLKSDWSQMTQEEFFVYATITSLFTEIVLLRSDSKTDTLVVPFSFGK